MDKKLTRRLCLGTAQLGMDYGIANKKGRLSKDEVFEILENCRNYGIDTLDTAYEYGDSEEVIGNYISVSKYDFKIISKMPKDLDKDQDPVVYCEETAGRLKVDKFYGYLLRSSYVSRYDELYKGLSALKKDGLIRKIGISLYTTDAIERILKSDLPLDIIQVPYNVFDQRFERYFPLLKKRNVEIYTRSVFLQGLFFLDEARIARDFGAANKAVMKLRDISDKENIPVSGLCLCFVLLNSNIDKVIIGVDSAAQLKENVHVLEYIDHVRQIYSDLKSLELEKEEIILPYNWK